MALKNIMRETPTGFEELFWEMDKDRSGNLSMGELAQLLKRNGYTLDRKALEAKFAGMDKDGDAKVSYDEYLVAMNATPGAIHRQAFYRRKFKRYDKNGDGNITLDELKDLFKSSGITENVQFAEEAFKQCDKDGSGKMEYEEFIKYFCSD